MQIVDVQLVEFSKQMATWRLHGVAVFARSALFGVTHCRQDSLSKLSFVHAQPGTQLASEASQLASLWRARSRIKSLTERTRTL